MALKRRTSVAYRGSEEKDERRISWSLLRPLSPKPTPTLLLTTLSALAPELKWFERFEAMVDLRPSAGVYSQLRVRLNLC